MSDRSFSLSQLLSPDRAVAKPVCNRNGVTTTLAEFVADVECNARRIRASGGRRILLAAADAYWGAVGLLAAVASGADVVLAPNDLASATERVLATCDLVVGEAVLPDAGVALQLLSAADVAPTGAPQQIVLDPAASITFHTSGSTGNAKLVVKTLYHLEREAAAIEGLLGRFVSASARIEATVPYQHAYGIAFRLIWPLMTGRMFAAATQFHLETCLAALDAQCVLVTSPAHLTRLSGFAPLPADRRPCLVLSAGAPLPSAAALSCAEILGTAPLEIFGSTETGAIGKRRRRAVESDWTVLPGVQISRADDGTLVAMADYIPPSNQKTADLIEIGSDGGFRFLGRKDDIVKIEGKRVSQASVERALAASEYIEQVAVVVLSGLAEGQSDRLAAVVVLSPAGRQLRQEIGGMRFQRALLARLRGELEPAALPRQWRFVAGLPRSALGKRRPAELAALFKERSS